LSGLLFIGALGLRAAALQALDGTAGRAPVELLLAVAVVVAGIAAGLATGSRRHLDRARRWWRWLGTWPGEAALAALVALAGAGVALLYVTQVRVPGLDSDFQYYFEMGAALARRGPAALLQEGGLQERPPLYPLFLAALYATVGPSINAARIAQALLHGALALVAYAGARRVAGRGIALPGALLVAWQPYVLAAAGVHNYEHLQALAWLIAAVWTWYTLQRERTWRYGVAAVLWALTALIKPYTLGGPLLLLGGLATWRLARRRWRPARGPLLFAGIFLLALVPWLIRTSLVYGTLVPVAPGLGFGVWAATLEPLPTDWGGDPRIVAVRQRAAQQAEQAGRSPTSADVDRLYLAESLAWIGADPARFARHLAGKQLQRWLLEPHDLYARYDMGPDERPFRLAIDWPQVQAALARPGLVPALAVAPLVEWGSQQARAQHLTLVALAALGPLVALARRDRAAALAQLLPWLILLTMLPTLAQNRYALPLYPLLALNAIYALACLPQLLPRPAAGQDVGGSGRASVWLRRGVQAALGWLLLTLALHALVHTLALDFLPRGLAG
jgi:4-amino-4-deoxy-L-arabinose transferase-like glycosyltransferase